MATITTFKRYEKKYILDRNIMNELLPTILFHMEEDSHCIGGRTYLISNLYYDTDRYDVIRESLSKPYYKEKFRLRSYGIPSSPDDRVFLEIKKKVGGMVTKRRVKLKLGEAEAFLAGKSLPASLPYMAGQVLREIRYYYSHVDISPAMRISYDRLAFFDRQNPGFRLTFDCNLRYLNRGESFKSDREGHPLMPDPFCLMEVKVSEAYPLWFTKLISEAGIHPASFSKYGVAYKTILRDRLAGSRRNTNVLAPL